MEQVGASMGEAANASGNAAPTIRISTATARALEGVHHQVEWAFAIRDPDSDAAGTIKSAVARVADGYRPGEDLLEFLPNSTQPIAAVWDAAAGTLTLTATAAIDAADWGRMLARVFYINVSDTPATHARRVSFVVNDGAAASAPAFKTVEATAVNDAPALDLNGAAGGTAARAAYTEHDAPVLLMPDAVVIDRDSADLDGGVLRVTQTGRNERGTAQDVVVVSDRGGVRVVDGTVSVGGVVVGAVSGGSGGAELSVRLNASATVASAQAVLRAITYRNLGDAPPDPGPSFIVRLGDGDGGIEGAASASVAMSAVDDPAVIDLNGGREGTRGAVHLASASTLSRIAPDAVFGDPDNVDFGGGLSKVDVLDARVGDALALLPGTGPDEVALDGDRLLWRGTTIGFVDLDGTASASIRFSDGIVPTAAVQALLRSIGFTTSSGDSGAREVEVRLSGVGADVTASASITFDQPPMLTGTSGADALTGGAVGEVLSGLAGNDALSGLGGRDLLDGGLGDDRLAGGAGGDAFLFAGRGVGNDRIADYGMDDVIVTTIRLADKDGDGKLGFGSDRDLDFAGGGQAVITTDTGARLTQVEYDGSFAAGGVTYYVYSRIGSAAGVADADALI